MIKEAEEGTQKPAAGEVVELDRHGFVYDEERLDMEITSRKTSVILKARILFIETIVWILRCP